MRPDPAPSWTDMHGAQCRRSTSPQAEMVPRPASSEGSSAPPERLAVDTAPELLGRYSHHHGHATLTSRVFTFAGRRTDDYAWFRSTGGRNVGQLRARATITQRRSAELQHRDRTGVAQKRAYVAAGGPQQPHAGSRPIALRGHRSHESGSPASR